ncbi:MFS transporter [Rhodococcus sp. NPDC057529]|uniref:MFS transporter n=1 Tax=Rhodococcus sp. NPDC057529 TaxID=3346158 RepID=UPI00366D8AE9
MNEQAVRDRIDNRGWGPFFRKLWIASGLGWMADSMNVAALGLVLPLILVDLGISRAEGGFIVSATFVGFMLGGILTGRLADILGRRTLLTGNIVLFSLAAVMAGLSQDFWWLLIFRFIQGIGMGGEFPIIGTYLNEMSPTRYRARIVGLTSAFYAYGFALIPLIGMFVVPVVGWRGLFLALVIPVVVALWARRALPESPVFLARKGRTADAEAALQLIESGSTEKPAEKGTQEMETGGKILSVRTGILVITWILIFYAQYGFGSWLPSAINEAVGNAGSSYLLTSLLFSGMVAGYLLGAFWGGRFAPLRFLTFAFIEFGIALILFGLSSGIVFMMVFGWLAAAGYGFTTVSAYLYTPRLFDTSVRGTGMGLVTGLGRIGAVVGPFVVAVLNPEGSLGASFVSFGLASLAIVALFLLIDSRRVPAVRTQHQAVTA